MKPLVSILIPAYNAERWIADTLRSALAQTWPRKEIVVVDDGSTDHTLAVAQRFESDVLRVVTQRNQGASAARNHAFSLSHGDYIQWLDADDLLSPNKISKQMEVLESVSDEKVLASCGWGRFFYRQGRAVFRSTPLWCDLSPVEFLIRKMGQNLHMQTSTWLVSRHLTEAAGRWNTQLAVDDDGEYFCRVLLASEGVRFVPESKVYYRDSGTGSLSYVGNSDRKRESQWKSMQLHMRYLRSLEASPRSHAACINYMQTWIPCFDPARPDIVHEMQIEAASLGGGLKPPELPSKYSWIRAVFGTDFARRAQLALPSIKWNIAKRWDSIMLTASEWKFGPCNN